MKKVLFLALVATSILIVGCADENANYEQKVELTPEQQAQADKNMEGQQAPGEITPGQPVESVTMPPGKSGN